MKELARFGISMDAALMRKFDALVGRKGYDNRSEAIRDLVRGALVEDASARGNEEIVGTVTIVYDHHMRGVSDKLTEHQHGHHDAVVSVLHVHLNPRDCLEVIVVRGKAREVRKLADHLIGMKGVKHGKLVTTTTGEDLT
jgi:CopG family nickel-responsive transcriptional regulator